MRLTNDPIALSTNGIFSFTAAAEHRLGQKGVDRFGRAFRYVKAGASDLVAGNVIQGPAEITAHKNLTPTAASALGSSTITATLGAVAAAVNLYKDGFVSIDTTPGEGFTYAIAGHAAVLSSGVITLRLASDSKIQVALTTSSRVTLTVNKYKGVIQAPVTTLTGPVVGVAVAPITALYYGWIGVAGTFCTLCAGTPGPGVAVVSPGSAAGAVVVDGATAATQVVGVMAVTAANGLLLPVEWNLR